MKEYTKAIGETIRILRLSKDLTEQELGWMVFGETSKNSLAAQRKLSKIELGQQEPRISELIAIAKALGVDCSFIVNRAIRIHKS